MKLELMLQKIIKDPNVSHLPDNVKLWAFRIGFKLTKLFKEHLSQSEYKTLENYNFIREDLFKPLNDTISQLAKDKHLTSDKLENKYPVINWTKDFVDAIFQEKFKLYGYDIIDNKKINPQLSKNELLLISESVQHQIDETIKWKQNEIDNKDLADNSQSCHIQ